MFRLQEGPKHNLKTEVKTECLNNIKEHRGKELSIKQLLWERIPFHRWADHSRGGARMNTPFGYLLHSLTL